jgi:hypothetical protein
MADTRRNARRMGIGLKRLKGLKHVHVVIKSSTTRMRESVLCEGHTESELLRKAYLITKIRLNIINFNRVCRIVVKLVLLRSCTQNGSKGDSAEIRQGGFGNNVYDFGGYRKVLTLPRSPQRDLHVTFSREFFPAIFSPLFPWGFIPCFSRASLYYASAGAYYFLTRFRPFLHCHEIDAPRSFQIARYSPCRPPVGLKTPFARLRPMRSERQPIDYGHK